MDDRILQIAAALWGPPAEERGRASPVFSRETRARGSRESVNPTIMPPAWRQRMRLPQRSYEAPVPPPQEEPYGPYGPGAALDSAPRIAFSDVAMPTFADLPERRFVPAELLSLPSPIATVEAPGAGIGGPESPRRNDPASAAYEIDPAYRRRHGAPRFEAHYNAQMLPNGAAIRTNEPRFDTVPEVPLSARRSVSAPSQDDELDAIWRRAMVRMQMRDVKRQHAIRK